MEAYDSALVPRAFGLHNTGAACYLNSFLQMLASCTAVTRAVLGNADYLSRSRTGAAMLAFFGAFDPGRAAHAHDLAFMSVRVLDALRADLAERRPKVRFGAGQESASEALVHLLDMMEPPGEEHREAGSGVAIQSIGSPVTRLFLHRIRCDVFCSRCARVVSSRDDYGVTYNLFHIDAPGRRPRNAEDFAAALVRHVKKVPDYECEKCKTACAAFLIYSLVLVPEVLVCSFNLYEGFGGERYARAFPLALRFPAAANGQHCFRLVGQVEHSGSLSGGHYWARCLRAGGAYRLDDTGVSPTALGPTPDTYLAAYHYSA